MKHFDFKFVRNFCLLVNLIIVGGIFHQAIAQTNDDFTARFPNELIRGDFELIGNSNVQLVPGATHNGDGVSFVDIDGDNQTANSSSAKLAFSTENGADPSCTRVLFAGLYWSGRAQTRTDEVSGPNPDGSINPARFDKKSVKLKFAGDSYRTITADHIVANAGGPADVSTNQGMYVAFADITDYVNENKEGEYIVADIATTEGVDQSGVQIGYYGGWGLVVVYANPVMNPRNIVVFDGFRFVQKGGDINNNQIDIDGFVAIDKGPVNVKLGVMAGEGDLLDEGDFLSMYNKETVNYDRLTHDLNQEDNFFNSTIFPHGERHPELDDNAGTELAMFYVDNDDKSYIGNGDTQTSFRYGTEEDVFVIYNFTFAVDAYIAEVEAINQSVSGIPSTGLVSAGDEVDFELVIRNRGNEAIEDAVVTIPLPDFVDITYFTASEGVVSIDENTGNLIWNIGDIEQPADPNAVLATLTYSLTVKDCEALIAAGQTCVPVVNVNGTLQGTSAVSLTEISTDFISDFAEPDVECVPEGNPIYDDITFSIDLSSCFDFTAEVATLCPGSTTTMVPSNVGGVWTSSDEAIATVDENGVVTAVSPGEVEITYSATGDPDCETKTTQTITVRDDCAVVSTKAVSDENGDELAQAGEILTYTISVSNSYDREVTRSITDGIPDNTVFVEGSITGGGVYDAASNSITWTSVSVPAADEVSVSFSVTVTDDLTDVASIRNSAVVTGDDPNTPDEPEVETPTDPEKSFTSEKSADKATVKAGEELTYTITVTNIGDVDYEGITISDEIPMNTTYKEGSASAGATLTGDELVWTVDVPFGESAAVSFTVVVDEDLTDVASIRNSAVVTGDDPNTPDEPEVETPVEEPPVDEENRSFASTKTVSDATGDGKAEPGEELTFTITVANTGDGDYEGITIEDYIPEHTTYVAGSATHGGKLSDDMLTWVIDLPVAGEEAVSFKVTVIDDVEGKDAVRNVATVIGGTPENPEKETPESPELPIIYGPEANDDHTSTNQGTPVTLDVVDNDVTGSSPVVPGTVLLIEPGTGNKVNTVTIEGEGTYTVGADGAVAFTPDAEYVGNSTISYTVKDENGLESNEAVISVTVEGVAAEIAPTAVDDAQTAPYGQPVTMDVLRNDVAGSSPIVPTSVTLIDGSGNRTNTVMVPGEGRYEVNAQGTVTFIPENGFAGISTVQYEITDENGLVSNPAAISVTINERPFKIPNVFTPNGDGKNDVFEIVGIEGFDRVEITVVNRWGNEVYRNNNYRNDWNGQGLNEGTYYYVIITHDGSRQERYAGWVLIKKQ